MMLVYTPVKEQTIQPRYCQLFCSLRNWNTVADFTRTLSLEITELK